MSMWEPFTERARRSIVLAQEEAQRLGNNYIGTEHILLALIRDTGIAGKALSNLGVTYDRTYAEIIKLQNRV